MAVNSYDPSDGHPIFVDTDAPDIKVDPTKVAEYAARVGTRLIGSTAERTAYAYAREGLSWYDTDLDAEFIHDGSGWVKAWTPQTAAGSVVPTAGAGFTLSNNTLYTRDGWLLGSIDYVKGVGALSHADVICTMPVGARPTNTCAVGGTMAPTPSQPYDVMITSAGVLQILVPPSGRTGGSLHFAVPIPR